MEIKPIAKLLLVKTQARKIAHLMIRCRTGDPLLFRMTRNSRLMLSIRRPLSVGGSKAYTLPRVGRRFRQPLVYQYLVHVLPMLVYYLADEPPAGGPPRHGRAPPPPLFAPLTIGPGVRALQANFAFTAFSAPLCQAALREGA